MADSDDLKTQVCTAIDASCQEILDAAEAFFQHPQLGYKETWAAARVCKILQSLGVPHRAGLACTGVKGWLESGRSGPSVAMLAELDAIVVPEHPQADARTGAAHACGHHMQLAAMLGAAMGLVRAGVLPHLDGRAIIFGVPAEEYVDTEYRLDLVRRGQIEFLSGKAELVRMGEFRDIDIALMVHASSSPSDGLAAIHASSNGMVAKLVQFSGIASHAGGAPWAGVNALSAARIALAAIDAQRDTFRDEDSIRVHSIITRGGSSVNVVPDDVRIEAYVRGKTAEAIAGAETGFDRAMRAGAVALGSQVRIKTMAGYLPLRNDRTLAELFKQNMLRFVPSDQFKEGSHLGVSTDMGDLSHLMPALQPFVGGAEGALHGGDFRIVDPVHAYVNSAKSLAMTVIDLLADDARVAKRLLASFVPLMTREQYLAFMRNLSRLEHFDGLVLGPTA